MIKLGLILLLLATTSASFLRKNFFSSKNTRIVGGDDAKPGQFPAMVSLRNSTSLEHICGGTLIKYDWIVTAAHCVETLVANQLIVVAGSIKLDSGGESRKVIKIVVHEAWGQNQNMLENDIALLNLETPYKESEYIKTVDLFCINLDLPLDCILNGWGRTSYDGDVPNTLQTLNMTTITNEECIQKVEPIYAHFILKSNVCGLTKAGEGPCNGDSGGPLLFEDEARKQWLHGIVSWGSPCANGVPDVYTKVAAFCDWLQQHTS